MSIFAKKQEMDQKMMTPDAGSATPTLISTSKGGYGIAEAIQLLRGLPVDQNPDLVVRVVRATLASLSVHLSDIIEDANKKQKATQDRIARVTQEIAQKGYTGSYVGAEALAPIKQRLGAAPV